MSSQYSSFSIPLADRTSFQSGEQNHASISSYPLEEIGIAQDGATRVSRRSSNASLMSVTSSQIGQPVRSRLRQAFESIVRLLQKLHNDINNRIRQSQFHGWRMGVLLGCCSSAFVLACNIIMAVFASQVHGGYKAGIADLIIGSATAIANWNTAGHLLINVFSTTLLGASNYTMQVLSSPTREDLDEAHARRKWLDVGILSIRNLRGIPRRRAAIWVLLATSSIPLHLFYNAAVFKTTTYNKFNIYAVDIRSEDYLRLNASTSVQNDQAITHRILTNNKWKEIYNTKFVSENGDLHLVLDSYAFMSSQNTSVGNVSRYYPIEIPGTQLNIQRIVATNDESASNWVNFTNLKRGGCSSCNVSSTWPVYARSESAIAKIVEPESRLQISLTFMLIVISFNFLKVVIMGWVLFTDRSAYIVTLGDAAASYLARPDPTTRYQCTLGKEEILFRLDYAPGISSRSAEETETLALRSQGMWLPQRREMFLVLGRIRQIFFALLLCLVVSATILLPLLGRNGYVWGTSSDTVVNEGADILTNAWLVNTPQMGLSFCYLALNSICTSLAGAEEWNNLARKRKGLRVTDPQGQQRSTYFLQLPYRWSAPLLIVSGTLHWLLSQTFFLVRLNMLGRDGQVDYSSSQSACGYSQLSAVVFWTVACVLLATIAVVANRKMQQRMPVAASCSLAISAACHAPDEDGAAHLGKVRWGVAAKQVMEGFEHACLTTQLGTKKLVTGRSYR